MALSDLLKDGRLLRGLELRVTDDVSGLVEDTAGVRLRLVLVDAGQHDLQFDAPMIWQFVSNVSGHPC